MYNIALNDLKRREFNESKNNYAMGMDSNIYRHAYVCIVFPSDHKQYTRTQEQFFTAYSCCNKLHFMGKLRFFSKEKRLADCGGKSYRCSFRCYSCGYGSITDDFPI